MTADGIPTPRADKVDFEWRKAKKVSEIDLRESEAWLIAKIRAFCADLNDFDWKNWSGNPS